jgi:HrpA-like RNA helicase
VTDEVLLQELAEDPNLARYSCLVVDEAHQRRLETDVLLALVKASRTSVMW